MNENQIFTQLQTIAKGWRCWDRTENGGTEQRIIDGAAWGILYAIKEGKVPGLTLKPTKTVTVTGWVIKVWLVHDSGIVKDPVECEKPTNEGVRYWDRGGDFQEDPYPTLEACQQEIDKRKDWEKTTRWRGFIPVKVTITIEDHGEPRP